jgi:flavin reductase (DIM6/NTAB) family NADH-FMN oxidoreductase RutF
MTAPASAGPDGRLTAATGPQLRRLMRRWATGAAVVTSRAADEPIGCTVNALTSVSLDPPILLISLSRDSHTLTGILRHGRFGLSLLAWRQRRLATQFAATGTDRFSGVPYRLVHDVPVLDDSAAAAVCTVDRVVPVADHMLLLGSPLWCRQDDTTVPLVLLDGHCATADPDPA